MFGPVDDAHAAFADRLNELILPAERGADVDARAERFEKGDQAIEVVIEVGFRMHGPAVERPQGEQIGGTLQGRFRLASVH